MGSYYTFDARGVFLTCRIRSTLILRWSASVSVVCTLRQAHTTAWTDKPTLQRGQTIAHYSLQGNCPHVVGMRVIGHYTEAQPAAQEQYITGGRLTTCQAITEGLA